MRLKNSKYQLILAPILGITDHIFRNIYNKHFSGFDYAIAPYIISNKKNEYKKSLLDRVRFENNNLKTIPQILSNDAEQFINLAKIFADMGHDEINWNIACPYPRAIKKNLGSALLEKSDLINEILEKINDEKLNLNISIKLRLGLKSKEDIFNVIPVLNNYPLKTVTIHPRTASQMYKGSVDLDILHKITEKLNHEIIYSGDIKKVSDLKKFENNFPKISTIMIGRGILINPLLIDEMNDIQYSNDERRNKLINYHKELLETYSNYFSGDSHLLTRMKEIWFYQSEFFENSNKLKKSIKKCKTLDSFENEISNILNNV